MGAVLVLLRALPLLVGSKSLGDLIEDVLRRVDLVSASDALVVVAQRQAF